MKKYIFSIEEELDAFQLDLSEIIGPAAFYINSLWLGERLIEIFFYGEPFADIKCVERFLEGLKIPTEKIEDLSYNIKNSIQRKIYNFVIDFDESHSYDFKVTTLADVVVTDLGVVSPSINKEEEYIKELQENEDNGDHIPERYRRLVG